MILSSILKNVHKEDKRMAIIINFQEYVKTKQKKNNEIKTNNISTESGKLLFFNRKDITSW